MSVDENKAIIRRCLVEYSVSNQGALDEVFAPGYVHHSQTGPIDFDGFKRGLAMYYQAFPDGKLELHNMVGEGDTVVVRMTFRGTQTGDLMGMPPAGKPVSLSMITMYRFVDGKVQEDWELSDRLGMLQQLGVIPQRGA